VGDSLVVEVKSNPLNRILAVLIVFVGLAIAIVGGLVVRSAFIAPQAPRTAAERDFTVAQAKVKQKPRDAEAHNDLGNAYFKMGNYESAVAEFKKAMSLNKLFLVAQFNLAMVYRAQQRNDLAARELKALLKKYPGDDAALFRLGEIYLEERKYEEAAAAFRDAVKYNPIDADSRYYLALAYEKTGKKPAAIKEYKQVLRYIPDHKGARAALSRLGKK